MDIRQKITKYLSRARADPEIRKRLFAVTAACAILISISLIKPENAGISYILDDSGNLSALSREDVDLEAEYRVKVLVEGESEEDIIIVVSPAAALSQTDESENAGLYDSRILHEAEISGVISEIENSGDTYVELPRELSDGTAIRWAMGEEKSPDWLYIVYIYLVLAFFIVFGTRDREADRDRRTKEEIVRCIPRFTNQFLMLMNAGLILSDALARISGSYELIPEERRGPFEQEIINTENMCVKDGISAAAAISGLAAKYNVKELMRIAVFMTENEKRGSDIIESLSRESKFMWDERKSSAKEKGKAIDTKMAYPLGMLLIVLIIITMAPAMMSM